MRQKWILISIAAVLLLGGVLGSWYVLGHKLLYEIDLSQVTQAYTITIDDENGAENVVLVEQGQISMKSASCPDHLCVKQGAISNGILPIICLPNHIRISIVSQGEESYDVQVY